MNITLYYIKGINETDTPVFDTLANQRLFFSECERYVIDTGFYPPYFKNTITLDINDYDITSPSNYCSLNFNNKEYYYFIVAKRYIAETVVEIDIVMDTIQTYMFDVEFVYSVIDRLTIERWVNDGYYTINRDYIRENYSNGDYQAFYTSNIIEHGPETWWYVVKVATPAIPLPTAVAGAIPSTLINGGTRDIKGRCNYGFAVFPFSTKHAVYHDTSDPQSPVDVTVDIDPNAMGANSTDPMTLDIYMIPFNPLTNISILEGDIVHDSTFNVVKNTDTFGNDYYTLITIAEELTTRVHSNTFNPLPNYGIPSLGDRFLATRNPVLLDENYLKFTFGDPTIRTEYPLHILTSNSLKGAYWADFTTGTRYYNLYVVNNYDNAHGTIVSNQSVFHFDLRNDPWKEYLANNHATLTGSLATSAITAGSALALTGAAAGGFVPFSVPVMAGIGAVAGLVSNVKNRATLSSNLSHKPITSRQANSFIPDLLGTEARISTRNALCDNYKEVAILFESYGYKVDMPTTLNLFSMNNRYFYDYIQTKELNIHIGDRSTERDFITRFNNGLRLWHTTSGVLNAKSVSGVTLDLGQVCVYDNVENFLVNQGGE